jgi:hypothetical protein
MADTNRFKTTVLASVLMAASALGAHPQRAATQDFQVGPGLVIEMETSTTAPGLTQNVQQGLNSALMAIAVLVPQENVGDWNAAMDEIGPPETVKQDVTVYIKGARIRVDIGANSLLGRLAPDGSVSEWAVLDPASGRVMDSDFFDRAIRAGSTDEYEAFGGDADVTSMGVTASNEFRNIQGHEARKYTFGEMVVLDTGMEGESGTPLGVAVSSKTDAWVATDGPYTEDAGIVQFFRVFGRELGLMPEQSNSDDGLPPAAIVLEAHEQAFISIGTAGMGEPLATASSSTVVKSITRQELDDEMFSGFETGEKECDCSCDAFKELQAIGDLPKEQQQNHPKAMALSMCAPKCAMKWAMQCSGG